MNREIVDQNNHYYSIMYDIEVIDQDEIQILDEMNAEWVLAWIKKVQSKTA